MTLKNILKGFQIFCLITLLIACKKEGCTDVNALNYDENADVENNSCTYPDNTELEQNTAAQNKMQGAWTITTLSLNGDNYIGSAYTNYIMTFEKGEVNGQGTLTEDYDDNNNEHFHIISNYQLKENANKLEVIRTSGVSKYELVVSDTMLILTENQHEDHIWDIVGHK